MHVSDAVSSRRSIRAFLDQPIPNELIRDLLTRASRAPSGGNLQPWRIFVVNGESMQRFRKHVAANTNVQTPAYTIYPRDLKEPYRTSRYKVGEDMYKLLEIPREDKPARIRRLMENYQCFGAPAAIFCYIDRIMGPPQWADLGMYLQTFMLLAEEQGLGTCAQEAWSARPDTVRSFVNAPDELTIFCGMAIGYPDPEVPVNSLVSDREATDQFATFV